MSHLRCLVRTKPEKSLVLDLETARVGVNVCRELWEEEAKSRLETSPGRQAHFLRTLVMGMFLLAYPSRKLVLHQTMRNVEETECLNGTKPNMTNSILVRTVVSLKTSSSCKKNSVCSPRWILRQGPPILHWDGSSG